MNERREKIRLKRIERRQSNWHVGDRDETN